MEKKLIQAFETVFGNSDKTNLFFSPGRVNLIGEHIDYNGGSVFPCAITFGTYALVKRNDSNEVRVFSGNFEKDGIKVINLEDLAKKADDNFTVYIKGVLNELNKLGKPITTGLDVYIYGNIPNGSGLSSSASLEILFAMIFNYYENLELSMLEMVKLSQAAENIYVGVNCGIMDQFAIGMGKEDHAICLNTSTLEYTYAPAKLGDYSILIMNTNKKRELADSKYNERREECENALSILKQYYKCEALCDLGMSDLSKVNDILESETSYKRVRHCISENYRVKQAIKALANEDLVEFGKLLNQSHESLKSDYEVTGNELDAIVAAAQQCEGVLGARMTGAGFGGCAIALVKTDLIDNVIQEVSTAYTNKTSLNAEFYVAQIGSGAKLVYAN